MREEVGFGDSHASRNDYFCIWLRHATYAYEMLVNCIFFSGKNLFFSLKLLKV